ncbi:MAG: hypothetical protein JWM87_3160 [Candidatus Eremiobacteraeota bacterium]|nr:hypothetical protein [Candidatus Eremiobacteraeota bacterium]
MHGNGSDAERAAAIDTPLAGHLVTVTRVTGSTVTGWRLRGVQCSREENVPQLWADLQRDDAPGDMRLVAIRSLGVSMNRMVPSVTPMRVASSAADIRAASRAARIRAPSAFQLKAAADAELEVQSTNLRRATDEYLARAAARFSL